MSDQPNFNFPELLLPWQIEDRERASATGDPSPRDSHTHEQPQMATTMPSDRPRNPGGVFTSGADTPERMSIVSDEEDEEEEVSDEALIRTFRN